MLGRRGKQKSQTLPVIRGAGRHVTCVSGTWLCMSPLRQDQVPGETGASRQGCRLQSMDWTYETIPALNQSSGEIKMKARWPTRICFSIVGPSETMGVLFLDRI